MAIVTYIIETNELREVLVLCVVSALGRHSIGCLGACISLKELIVGDTGLENISCHQMLR